MLPTLITQGFFDLFINLILQSQIIGNHCDKFAICRLSAIGLNGVAEIGIESVNVASVPSDLDLSSYLLG